MGVCYGEGKLNAHWYCRGKDVDDQRVILGERIPVGPIALPYDFIHDPRSTAGLTLMPRNTRPYLSTKSFDRTWDLMQFNAGQIRGPKLIFELIQIE
jgi:hypothetical protein